jgi:hypothetical protein
MKTIKWLLHSVLLAAAMVLAACGGGDDDAPAPGPAYTLWITSPTSADSYLTADTSVSLSGGAFVPAGAVCTGIVGTMPPDYQVTWRNAANGSSGPAEFYLGCLLQVNVVWNTWPIALEPGDNPITVTAIDGAGHMASDTLVVTRLADSPLPAVQK